MAWGIEFKTDIYLLKQSFLTKKELEDTINELNIKINDCESKLLMFAIATPKDIVLIDKDDSSPEIIFNYINDKTLSLLELHEELIINRFKLNLYLEYLNEGNEIIKAN